jgi:uncharacterized protein
LLPLVIVFAKAPRPGFVKTRLGLEPTAAASLHAEFVRRTLKTVCNLRDKAELELSLDTPCTNWAEFSMPRTIQHAGDLGVRIYAALQRGLSSGHPNVVVLGSDSPTLPAEHVRQLLQFDTDVTLGPTFDGGYYGIACRKIMPTMFDGVQWSTRNALRDTIISIERCGMDYAIGPEWFDVDTPEDLLRIRENLNQPGHVKGGDDAGWPGPSDADREHLTRPLFCDSCREQIPEHAAVIHQCFDSVQNFKMRCLQFAAQVFQRQFVILDLTLSR